MIILDLSGELKRLFHPNKHHSYLFFISLLACEHLLHSQFVTHHSHFSWQSNGLPEVIYRLLDCAPWPNMLHTGHNWWTLGIVGEEHERNRPSPPLKGGGSLCITTKHFHSRSRCFTVNISALWEKARCSEHRWTSRIQTHIRIRDLQKELSKFKSDHLVDEFIWRKKYLKLDFPSPFFFFQPQLYFSCLCSYPPSPLCPRPQPSSLLLWQLVGSCHCWLVRGSSHGNGVGVGYKYTAGQRAGEEACSE